MGPPSNLPANLFNHYQYAGPYRILLYPHNTALLQLRICSPPMTRNSDHRPTNPAHPRIRTPPPRRYPRPPNPHLSYYRNNQLNNPTNCPRRSTHSQPNSRSSPHSPALHRRIRSIPHDTRRCPITNNLYICANPLRSSRGYNPSLRVCSPLKPLPTRKRLMAHQAHAYHIVDPSP